MALESGDPWRVRVLVRDLEAKLKAATPLWYYLLREAELGGGESLGPVGGRIVAEVLVGLLQGDPLSYIRQMASRRARRRSRPAS